MRSKFTNAEVPKILYKYRDWSNKLHRRIISHQEIYFPKPSEFNDPFDGNIPIRWDKMTYEDCFNKNLELISITNGHLDQRILRAHAKKITDEKIMYHPDKLLKESAEQLKKWNDRIGLFSASAVPDNILMWSHYSKNHTGFTVGFDVDGLSRDYDFDFIDRIVYQKEYPVISGLDELEIQFHKKYFYKSDLWAYEDEWRVTKNNIKKRTFRLNKNTIKEVYIGCCAGEYRTNQIIKTVRKYLSSDCKIIKFHKDDENFALVATYI